MVESLVRVESDSFVQILLDSLQSVVDNYIDEDSSCTARLYLGEDSWIHIETNTPYLLVLLGRRLQNLHFRFPHVVLKEKY